MHQGLKNTISSNSEISHLLSIRGLHQLETANFMHKFHQQHLPIIFKYFFQPNCLVHYFSTRSKDNYHLPHFSKSVSQQSIEFKKVKIWNTLLVEIRHLRYNFLFVSKISKYLAQQINLLSAYKRNKCYYDHYIWSYRIISFFFFLWRYAY